MNGELIVCNSSRFCDKSGLKTQMQDTTSNIKDFKGHK